MRNNTSTLESVDNALRLLLLLGSAGQLGVTQAARELGVTTSTAHRLLSTFKDRGFVIQQPNRSYAKGPAFAELQVDPRALNLEQVASPHLDALRREMGETTHLMVRQDRHVRFLASFEADQVLRATSRAGSRLPAHQVSGGRALLAELSSRDLTLLYPAEGVPALGLDGPAVNALRRELAATRQRGYGQNRCEGERGIAAIGMSIHGPNRKAAGAFSISLPTMRYSRYRLGELVAAARTTRARIEADLTA